MKTRPPKISPEVAEEIRARYTAQCSQFALAKEYQIGAATVWSIIHQKRGYQEGATFPTRVDGETADEIRSRYAPPISVRQLAEEYGVSPLTITAVIHRTGAYQGDRHAAHE